MFTKEQKFWIVKEMADSKYPITMRRNIFKRFAVEGIKILRTIKGLHKIVNNAARKISEETVRRAAASILQRVENVH